MQQGKLNRRRCVACAVSVVIQGAGAGVVEEVFVGIGGGVNAGTAAHLVAGHAGGFGEGREDGIVQSNVVNAHGEIGDGVDVAVPLPARY